MKITAKTWRQQLRNMAVFFNTKLKGPPGIIIAELTLLVIVELVLYN